MTSAVRCAVKGGVRDALWPMRKKKRKVLFDTNFFLLPEQCRIDIFKATKELLDVPAGFFVLEGTLKELKALASARGSSDVKLRDRQAAKLGLHLATLHLKAKDLKIVAHPQPVVDDALLALAAADASIIVATADGGLRKRLSSIKAPVITVRQKRYLIFQR